jgi:WD40 repeat protein
VVAATRKRAFSPDGRLLAVADYHGRTALLWDVFARRKIESPIGLHSSAVLNVAFSPDGKFLGTGDHGEVSVWDLSGKSKDFAVPKSTSSATFAFHPVEPILAVASRRLSFWDLKTGQLTNLLTTAPTNGAQCPAFSPNRKLIAVGMGEGTVLIGDLETGRTTAALLKHATTVRCVCFSRDSTLLASGGEDHRVILYDLRQRRVIKTIQAHTEEVRALAFTTDDRTIVSTSSDGTIKFWSVANQQLVLTLIHDGGPVTGVSFTSDGRLMATSGSDGTVRLWAAPTFEEIEAEEKAARAAR